MATLITRFLAVMCVLALIGAAGCGGGLRPGTFGVQEQSYDLKGELVEVELLTKAQYRRACGELNIRPQAALWFEQPTFLDIGLGDVVGKIIELGAKWIQGELVKEAERYRQQFSGSAFRDGFWQPSESGASGLEPDVYGLRVRRYTDAYSKTGGRGPAFEFLAALKISGDRNFLIIHPLYLRDQSAKAKVRGERVQIELQIEQTGHWLDPGGVLKTTTLAVASKKLSLPIGPKPSTWNLTGSGMVEEEDGRVALEMWGALAAPPISANSAKDRATGILHVTCTVTETDQTKAAEYFRKAAGFVEEKSPEVAAAVRERVNKALDKAEQPPAAPTPAPAPPPAGGAGASGAGGPR